MNSPQTTDFPSPFHSQEEAMEIEGAVRAAVLTIMKVFLDLNDKRARGFQQKLVEMEKENMQLKVKLEEAEHHLQTLQHIRTITDITFSPQSRHSSSTVRDQGDQAAASSQSLQPLSEKETFAESPEYKLYKEEPLCEESFWIKNEIAEETCAVDFDYQVLAHVGRTLSSPSHQQIPSQRFGACNSFNHSVQEDHRVLTSLQKKRLSGNERVKQYRARIRADPERYLIWKEKERLRYLRKRKSIAELPEPMKSLKRKAWREASKRHRARMLNQLAISASHITNTTHT